MDAPAGREVPPELDLLGQRELFDQRLQQIRGADDQRLPEHANQLQHLLLQIMGRYAVLFIDQHAALAELAGHDRFVEFPERGFQRIARLSVPAQGGRRQAALVRENFVHLHGNARQQRKSQRKGSVHRPDVQADEERRQPQHSDLHVAEPAQLHQRQSFGKLSGTLVLPQDRQGVGPGFPVGRQRRYDHRLLPAVRLQFLGQRHDQAVRNLPVQKNGCRAGVPSHADPDDQLQLPPRFRSRQIRVLQIRAERYAG